MSHPSLVGLSVADAPAAWEGLGFSVSDGVVALGAVAVRLGGPGRGITGWTLSGVEPGTQLDGLATEVSDASGPGDAHPNGALGLDHVVVTTPDFDRTSAALAAAGMPLRRIRHVERGDFRQGFRRLGPAILELVEARDAPPGPAAFWGLVVTVADLAQLAARLGPERLGEIRPAVQPGRQIATLRRGAGLSPAVAFMDPEPAS